MKITKRQLRKLIKEESAKLVKENNSNSPVVRAEDAFLNALDNYITVLDESMGYDVPVEELKAVIMPKLDWRFEMIDDMMNNDSDLNRTIDRF